MTGAEEQTWAKFIDETTFKRCDSYLNDVRLMFKEAQEPARRALPLALGGHWGKAFCIVELRSKSRPPVVSSKIDLLLCRTNNERMGASEDAFEVLLHADAGLPAGPQRGVLLGYPLGVQCDHVDANAACDEVPANKMRAALIDHHSGFFELDIVAAEGLRAADPDGTSDPFCVVLLNGVKKFETPHVKGTLDPAWQDQHSILPFSTPRKSGCPFLQIQCWDHDPKLQLGSLVTIGSDDFLGEISLTEEEVRECCRIDQDDIVQKLQSNDSKSKEAATGALTIQLSPRDDGEVEDVVQGALSAYVGGDLSMSGALAKQRASEKIDIVERSERKMQEARAELQREHDRATFKVQVVSAAGLRIADTRLVGAGSSDPFCKVSVNGEVKFTTPIINKNLNPVWADGSATVSGLEFSGPPKVGHPFLEVACFDDDGPAQSADFLGQVSITGEEVRLWANVGDDVVLPFEAGRTSSTQKHRCTGTVTLRVSIEHTEELCLIRTAGAHRLLGGGPTSTSNPLGDAAEKCNHAPFLQQEQQTLLCNIGKTNKEEVLMHANGVAPIAHKDVRALICDFVQFKRSHEGSRVERAYYKQFDPWHHEDDLHAMVTRLLTKRPLTFFKATDEYLLRDGVTHGCGGFELIGTDAEEQHPDSHAATDHAPNHKPVLAQPRSIAGLEHLLSYDEMALSALLGVAVPTHFVNNGARSNRGVPGCPGEFERTGVLVGLVGARFEKPDQMESLHMLVTRKYSTAARGYGARRHDCAASRKLEMWAQLYNQTHQDSDGSTQYGFPDYNEARENFRRYGPQRSKFFQFADAQGEDCYLNTEVYRRRMRLILEPLLLDANERGHQAGRLSYVHVVGLGLGVWALPGCDDVQAGLLLQAVAEVLSTYHLEYVGDIDFSWFPRSAQRCGGVANGGIFQKGGNSIAIHFSARNPADKLPMKRLLVCIYAWDSNSYPGNEYWLGAKNGTSNMLAASGDPAAAACSCITELQLPEFNPRVSGACLKWLPRPGVNANTASAAAAQAAEQRPQAAAGADASPSLRDG